MKLATTLVVIASAATSVMGYVANKAFEAAIAQAAGKTLEALVRPGKIQCHTTDLKDDTRTKIGPIRDEGFGHLMQPHLNCDVGPGGGCGRISCSHNAGVYICPRNVTETIPFSCFEAASFAMRILEECSSNDQVKGAAWDEKHQFTIEIHHDVC
ncbi:hypothetical protein B0T25DRAFT_562243 [Lasiosphaeria hispida]|uniref:Uncharacterized protein n=1 Tax=Lasiosphaeria hispida TaxID=260671 RepID=A0AAJ0HUM6_9PEZI|nr:hypothetical protein B0T25DRAFT_562243 [Lasiosphaeria hispida]